MRFQKKQVSALPFLDSEIAAEKKKSRPNRFEALAILKNPFLCRGNLSVWAFLQCVRPGPDSRLCPGVAETANAQKP